MGAGLLLKLFSQGLRTDHGLRLGLRVWELGFMAQELWCEGMGFRALKGLFLANLCEMSHATPLALGLKVPCASNTVRT